MLGRCRFGDVNRLLERPPQVNGALLDHLPDVFDPVLLVLDARGLREAVCTRLNVAGKRSTSGILGCWCCLFFHSVSTQVWKNTFGLRLNVSSCGNPKCSLYPDLLSVTSSGISLGKSLCKRMCITWSAEVHTSQCFIYLHANILRLPFAKPAQNCYLEINFLIVSCKQMYFQQWGFSALCFSMGTWIFQSGYVWKPTVSFSASGLRQRLRVIIFNGTNEFELVLQESKLRISFRLVRSGWGLCFSSFYSPSLRVWIPDLALNLKYKIENFTGLFLKSCKQHDSCLSAC